MFGPNKSYEDVRRIVAYKLLKKWRYVTSDDIDDALGAAVLDWWSYHRHLPSSQAGDEARRLDIAVLRGYHVATAHLVKRADVLDREGTGFYDDDNGDTDERPAPFTVRMGDFATPSAEDEALERIERAEVRRAVNGLPASTVAQLAPVASGETVRAQASRLDVPRSAAFRDRRAGLAVLRSAVAVAA